MARINNAPSGFTPVEPSPPKRRRSPPHNRVCGGCDGLTGRMSPREKLRMTNYEEGGTPPEFLCRYCIAITGADGMRDGVTDGPLSRVVEAGEAQWVIALRRTVVGAPSGRTLTVEMGDIMKVSRAGHPNVEDGGSCARDRSTAVHSIDVSFGPVPVTLWPHEFAPIQWATIMELRNLKQVSEEFVEPDDSVGYFAPTDEIRAELRDAFGDR